jgi:glycerol-3-phosphate acyltransferase PlsY
MNTFYIILICLGFAIIGYLLGSVLFSEILGKCVGKNIREHGSKNPGATNLSRSTSKVYGFLGAFLDAIKGYLAVILSLIIYRYSIFTFNTSNELFATIYIAGTFAVIGHCFPLLYIVVLCKNKFNFEQAKSKSGGKGVSTAGGVLFAASP